MPRPLSLLLLATGMACSLLTRAATPAPPTAPPATDPPTVAPEPPPTEPAPPASPVPPTAAPEPVRSLPDASGYTWAQVAGGLTRPLGLANAGDERLFIIEQRGVIRVFSEGQLLEQPFLDIRDRVVDQANEQGLLGLAFHPGYAQNGYFYVNYTGQGGGTLISRFEVSAEDPHRADPGSEFVLLSFNQPFRNHNGGALAFGPDGYLYIGTGDGGSGGDPQGNGQRLDTLLGKILRLDVDSAEPYAIPPDNPLAGGGGRAEIWAYGLRNPWRLSFDPLSGDLYLGDVGQNAWEEISYLPAGQPGGVNFGWNHREGAHPFATNLTEGLTDPVAEYRNGGGECSVTGGEVVRNAELPEWEGVYLYGDYCSGRIWGLIRDSAGAWRSEALFETGFRISSFGRGHDGRVYVVDHGGGVYRLQSAG